MRLGIIFKSSIMSGAEKRSTRIARALNQRDRSATLLLDRATANAATSSDWREPWPPVVCWSTPKWHNWLKRGRRRLAPLHDLFRTSRLEAHLQRKFWKRIVQRENIDVIHVFLGENLTGVLPCGVVFEVTSPDVARRITKNPKSIPQHVILHAVSDGVANIVRPHFENHQVITAPMPFFDPSGLGQEPSSTKENIVLYGHRLIDRKNPVIFAEAAKRFLAQRPNWRVLIRGSGPLKPRVLEILSHEIKTGRAEFGYSANLVDDLWRSRIFASIIEPDNYPSQSVLEAMWCRNALLLSDRGSTRSRFFNNNGILTEPDADKVTDALLAMTSDPDKLGQYGINSRRHVETAFDRDKFLNHLEEVYQLAIATAKQDRRLPQQPLKQN